MRTPAWAVVNVKLGSPTIHVGPTRVDASLYMENLFNSVYYEANTRGTSPVQYLQPPRTLRLALTTTL